MTNFPFGDDFMPQFLNDIFAMISTAGDAHMQIAEQLANSVVKKEAPIATVDPKLRISLEPLAAIVKMHFDAFLEDKNLSQLPEEVGSVEFVSPQTWLDKSLKELNPIFSEIADSFLMKDETATKIDQTDLAQTANPEDQIKNILSNVFQMTAPASLGMQIGSILGHFALSAFGSYDLLIPRETDTVLIIADNIQKFSDDWSVEINDAAIWTCTRQLAAHFILSKKSIKSTLTTLISRHALGLRVGTEKLSEQIKTIDFSDFSSFENLLNNPDSVFEIEPSLIHEQTTEDLTTIISVINGFIQNVGESIDEKTVGKSNLINEAVLRYKTQYSNLSGLIETLFGYYYDDTKIEQGYQFVKNLLLAEDRDWIEILTRSDEFLPDSLELEDPENWKLRVATLL